MEKDKAEGRKVDTGRRGTCSVCWSLHVKTAVLQSPKKTLTNTVSTFHCNVAPDQDQQMCVPKESGGKSVYLQLSSFVSLPRMISLVIDQYPSMAICGRFVWALCE